MTVETNGRVEGTEVAVAGGPMNLSSGGQLSVETLVLDSIQDRFGPNGSPTPVVHSLATGATTELQVADRLIVGRGSVESYLTLSDGVTASLGRLTIAAGTTEGTLGRLDVEEAAVTAKSVVIGNQQITDQAGRMSLHRGSQVTVEEDVVVGAAAESVGNLNVGADSRFVAGQGFMRVNATGTVNVTGGIRLRSDVVINGGTWNVSENGTMDLASGISFTIGQAGSFHSSNAHTIDNVTLNVQGGSSFRTLANLRLGHAGETHAFVQGSETNFRIDGDLGLGLLGGTGVLSITDQAVFRSESTSIGAAGQIEIDDATVNLGQLQIAEGRIQFRRGALRFEGDLRIGPTGILGNDFVVTSEHDLRLEGQTVVEPRHSLRIDGGYFSTTGLNSSEQGGFELLSGTWNLAGGNADLVAGFDIGENAIFTGHGELQSPNEIAAQVRNAGTVAGRSPQDRLILRGYVTGDGTLDNVVIAGTYSPGVGPASVVLGRVQYAENSTLLLDLGSVDDDTTRDLIQHDAVADIQGRLSLSTTSEYRDPENRGDVHVHTLITGPEINGEFSDVMFRGHSVDLVRDEQGKLQSTYVGSTDASLDGLFVRLDHAAEQVQFTSYLAIIR